MYNQNKNRDMRQLKALLIGAKLMRDFSEVMVKAEDYEIIIKDFKNNKEYPAIFTWNVHSEIAYNNFGDEVQHINSREVFKEWIMSFYHGKLYGDKIMSKGKNSKDEDTR